MFQTHAPARGATMVVLLDGWYTMFQPTRPRGARPGVRGRSAAFGRVSTHAPARGATTRTAGSPSIMASFNPRAREGRDRSRGCMVLRRSFQPTRPRGGATRRRADYGDR